MRLPRRGSKALVLIAPIVRGLILLSDVLMGTAWIPLMFVLKSKLVGVVELIVCAILLHVLAWAGKNYILYGWELVTVADRGWEVNHGDPAAVGVVWIVSASGCLFRMVNRGVLTPQQGSKVWVHVTRFPKPGEPIEMIEWEHHCVYRA